MSRIRKCYWSIIINFILPLTILYYVLFTNFKKTQLTSGFKYTILAIIIFKSIEVYLNKRSNCFSYYKFYNMRIITIMQIRIIIILIL